MILVTQNVIFKMSEEYSDRLLGYFPKIFIFYTVLTYTFVIPPSKQKHTTRSLTHTHTHTHTHMTSNNYKQRATGHVTSLANDYFTGSDAPFVCEIPIALSNKKRYNFADIRLAVGFTPTKQCVKRSRWFGKRHKTDAFTKLGEPVVI